MPKKNQSGKPAKQNKQSGGFKPAHQRGPVLSRRPPRQPGR